MTTPNLGLQEVPANSLQPSIPINDSLQALDALVQLSVIALTPTPPATTGADIGKRWLVDGGATGTWATHDGDVALCTGANLWRFFPPQDGWRAGTSGAIDYRYDAASDDWVIQAPLTNPMAVTGDLIVGGAAGLPTRLAVGANGKVLKVVGGVPAWGDESGAAVSSVNEATGTVIVPTPIIVACSDEATALTAGTNKITFRSPHAMKLTGVRASLTAAQAAGSIFTVDINVNGSSILSTKLTIDNGEKTSVTAAIAAVLSSTTIPDDAEVTVDIDQVGDGTAKGLKVTLLGYKAP